MRMLLKNMFLLVSLSLMLGFGEIQDKIEYSPTSINTSLEFGQIIKGEFLDDANELHSITGSMIQRTGISILEKILIDKKMEIRVGVGGLFWNAFPVRQENKLDNLMKFGPGISDVSLTYFLPGETKSNFIKVGFFPLKYNQDAKNLGEYLFRSGVYPNFVWTGSSGGWGIVNSAAYMAQGLYLHGEMLGGIVTHDLTLFMERDFAPYFDFTPSYMIGLNAGPIQIGIGLSFHHLIAKPSRLQVKDPLATWVSFDYLPSIDQKKNLLTGKILWDSIPSGQADGLEQIVKQYTYSEVNAMGDTIKNLKPYEEKWWNDTLITLSTGVPVKIKQGDIDTWEKLWLDTVSNSIVAKSKVPLDGLGNPRKDSIWVETQLNRYFESDQYRYARELKYFNHQGIKIMGRTSIDLKYFFQFDFLKKKDLTLFAEAAILGLKNQPFFFDKKGNNNILSRMPIMFGIHLPGFKVFDFLTVQGEYNKNPFKENIRLLLEKQMPVWKIDGDNYHQWVPFKKDDWKWGIYFNKQLIKGFTIHGQVASDHLRSITKNAQPSYIPLTNSPKQWYYMIKIEFGV